MNTYPRDFIIRLYKSKICYIIILTIWFIFLKSIFNSVNQKILLLILFYFPIIYTFFLFYFEKKNILSDYELDVLSFLVKSKKKVNLFRNLNFFLSILMIIINFYFFLYELFIYNNLIITFFLIVLLIINIFIISLVEYKFSKLKNKIIIIIKLLQNNQP